MNIQMLSPRAYRSWRLHAVGGALLFVVALHLLPQICRHNGVVGCPRTETILNHNVYWELPLTGNPTAVVFFAHGCHHAG